METALLFCYSSENYVFNLQKLYLILIISQLSGVVERLEVEAVPVQNSKPLKKWLISLSCLKTRWS